MPGLAATGTTASSRRPARSGADVASSSARRRAARGWRSGRLASPGKLAVQRHARAGSAEVVRRARRLQLALGQARERRRAGERQPRRASRRARRSSSPRRGSPARPLEPPAGGDRRHGQRARPRRAEDRNGPFLAAEVVRLGLEPDADRDRRRPARGARARAPGGARGRPLPRLGRPRADPRRPHGRAASRGSPGGRCVVDEALERGDRGRLAHDRGAARAAVRRLRDRRAQAGDASRGSDLARARGHGAGPRARARRLRRSSSCRARRASCGGSGRARSRPSPSAACSRGRPRASGASCASSARRESAVAEALARGGGDGDGVEVTICAREFEIHVDLFVEPGAEERADALAASLRERARPVPLRRGRALDRGDRPRPLPRARAHARDRGVVHGRAGRGAPDGVPGVERRLPRRRRRVRGRGEGARARRSGDASSASTARSRPRRLRRWRTACGSGSAPTSASR